MHLQAVSKITHFRPGPMPDTLLPEYEGLGLANVVPTVERHFGLDTPIAPLSECVLPPALLAGARTIVTLVVDALGWLQLQREMEAGHMPRLAALVEQERASLAPITSTFPSTTVTALTTLGTGLPPGGHGIVNHTLYDSLLGTTVDILRFAPVLAGIPFEKSGVQPGDWLGLPTVYEKLAAVGLESTVVNHRQFEGTSLSRINHRGARFEGFYTISDLCVSLRAVMENPRGASYIHCYWGMLDSVTHAYGPGSPQHSAEVRVLDHAIGELLLGGLSAPGTLLLLTADHGHIGTDPDQKLMLNDHPELIAMLQSPPAGTDRAVILYVRAGQEETARRYVEHALGEHVLVMIADESIELGLYGPPPLSEQARARIGQLLLLPRGNNLLKYYPPGKEVGSRLLGKHAGLTPQEMLSPLLALRLD